MKKLVIGALLCALFLPSIAQAQDTEALAKQVQNPVASLISVPFQNNFNFGVGPDNDLQYNLNIQPVLPIKLDDDWNLISRTVLPLIYQPVLAAGVGARPAVRPSPPQAAAAGSAPRAAPYTRPSAGSAAPGRAPARSPAAARARRPAAG